jgi:hypothetical protein
MSLRDAAADAAFRIAMATLGKRAFKRLMKLAGDPARAQFDTLMAILKRCAASDWGRFAELETIKGADDFRARIRISDYEDMRASVEKQIATGDLSISPETPVMYARTSGTTGKPKYIPVTEHVLDELKQAQRAMSYVLHRELGAFEGKILGLAGSPREETLARGQPAGATSGMIYATMPRFMRAKYVAPSEVFAIDDYDLKYRLIARMAARAKDMTLIATANPSSVLRLMGVIRRDLPAIAEEVEHGGSPLLAKLPLEMHDAGAGALKADRKRAAELRALAAKGDALTIGELWPNLRCVATWLGGGCAIAAEAVRAQLPPGAAMADPGYVASEMRGTIPVETKRDLSLPLLSDVFFEFVPVADWEAGERDTLLIHELEDGGAYHVIVTSSAGLMRYHMNDVVRVTGRVKATPTLAFVRKGRGVTSITGEKLSEDQVHAAMRALGVKGRAAPGFYIVTADGPGAHYRARIEQAGAPLGEAEAGLIDRALGDLNIEYRAKRDSGRLGPLQLVPLRAGAGDAYHRHCVENRGQREAQAKVLALQTEEELDFDFGPFVLDTVH